MLEQFIQQAHGPPGIVSDRAVYDLDLQHDPSENLGNYIIEAIHAKIRPLLHRRAGI
jgi:hypothetical protein